MWNRKLFYNQVQYKMNFHCFRTMENPWLMQWQKESYKKKRLSFLLTISGRFDEKHGMQRILFKRTRLCGTMHLSWKIERHGESASSRTKGNIHVRRQRTLLKNDEYRTEKLRSGSHLEIIVCWITWSCDLGGLFSSFLCSGTASVLPIIVWRRLYESSILGLKASRKPTRSRLTALQRSLAFVRLDYWNTS